MDHPCDPRRSYHLMFGLSADPIHLAHSRLLITAVKALAARGCHVEELHITPVYRRNPVGHAHKENLPQTFDHRLATCQIAAREIAISLAPVGTRVSVSPIARDLALAGNHPNYDVETLGALKHEGQHWLYQLSSDLLAGDVPEFARWHHPEELARMATLVVVFRPGYPVNERYLEKLRSAGGSFILLDDLPHICISSTVIRNRLTAGEDPLMLVAEGLLSPAVAAYIRDHNPYLSG